MKTKKSMDRYSRTHRSTPYSSEGECRSYSSRYNNNNYRSSSYYYGGRALEGSSYFKYNQQIPSSGVNHFLLNSTRSTDIINEPFARTKIKIPAYSENEELWKHYRIKEGSLLKENELVLRKDVRAMEKALNDSLQTYERENRCHLLIKRQIDALFTSKEIDELNLLVERNNKNDLCEYDYDLRFM